jgi:hypothetical protein
LADDGDDGRGPCGEAAGQRRIVVDVEFKKVEEGVRDGGDGAIDVGLDAILELKREAGLVAGREGDIFEVVTVLDVFTCVTGER